MGEHCLIVCSSVRALLCCICKYIRVYMYMFMYVKPYVKNLSQLNIVRLVSIFHIKYSINIFYSTSWFAAVQKDKVSPTNVI